MSQKCSGAMAQTHSKEFVALGSVFEAAHDTGDGVRAEQRINVDPHSLQNIFATVLDGLSKIKQSLRLRSFVFIISTITLLFLLLLLIAASAS